MTPPLELFNKQGKRFTWSHTALNQFDTCPAQYAAQRYYCTTQQEDTEETIWGTRVHKGMEERIRDKKPLEEDLQPFEKWARVIEQADGEKFCEIQFAIDFYLNLVPWYDAKAWGRGVVDVLIYDEAKNKISVLDYKTGKLKDDPAQLKLFACFASLLYPQVEEFNCKYIWLKADTATGITLHKKELTKIWDETFKRVFRVQEAWEHEVFNCNPSGLCRGWCPVTECIHYKEKR